MMQRWVEDWRHLGRGEQVTLIVLAALIVLLSLAGSVYNLLDRDYEEVAGFPIPIAILGARFVLWPFRLASAVRRRGGRFHTWLIVTIFLGFLIPEVAYFAWRSNHPILVESE